MFCSSVDVVSKINWKLEEGDVAAIPVWGVENIAFRLERAQEKVSSLGGKDKSGARLAESWTSRKRWPKRSGD